MELVRVWRARLLGGAAAAVVVPVTVVVATLAVGLTGGLAGLGALGQALTGPAFPDAETAFASPRVAGPDPGPLLDRALRGTATTPAIRRTRRATRPVRRRGTTPRQQTPSTPQRPTSPGAGGRPPSSPAPTPTPTPRPTPPPTPAPPSTVRQVGDTVKSVTNQVPVAGPPAAQVVDTIVETAESLPLPIPNELLPLP
jgi:hypothetical protein